MTAAIEANGLPRPATAPSAPSAVDSVRAAGALSDLLAECLRQGASDVHLSPDWPPCFRVHGDLRPVEGAADLSPADLEAIGRVLLGPSRIPLLEQNGAVDGSYTTDDGTRYRFNVFLRHG